MAEETKDPSRVFPTALFTGLAIALAVYILVTLVAGMAVPTDKLAGSDGPLLEVVQLGPLAMNTKVFSAIALFALANGALINMIMASRLIYGMAQQGIVPRRWAACTASAARRGSRSSSSPRWRSSSARWATSSRSPTRRCCSCSASSCRSTSRCSCCAATGSSTTTGARRRSCRCSASRRASR